MDALPFQRAPARRVLELIANEAIRYQHESDSLAQDLVHIETILRQLSEDGIAMQQVCIAARTNDELNGGALSVARRGDPRHGGHLVVLRHGPA